MGESTTRTRPSHEALAVVLQVRDDELQVLLWQRARDPFEGAWSLPGGFSRRAKRWRTRSAVTSRRRWTCRSSHTSSRSRPAANPIGTLTTGWSRPRSWGSSRARGSGDPRGHRLASRGRAARAAFDHGSIILAGRGAPAGEALLHERRLRARAADLHDLESCATCTAPRSATTSRRRTSSAFSSAAGCSSRPESSGSGPRRGRPAAVFRFRSRTLEVTDQFAVLRPPAAR